MESGRVAEEIIVEADVPPWRLTRVLAAGIGLAALALVWFTIGLAVPVPPEPGWLTLLAAVPLAVLTSWRAGGHGRTFWRYVSVGVGLVGVGAASAARDYFNGAPQGQISVPTTVVYVSGLVVMLLGLMRIPGARRTRIEWTRFGLDIATVIVTVLTFSWHLIYPRWRTWLGDSPTASVSFLVVVAAGFICVFAFIKVAFTGTDPIDRRALHILALCGAVGAGGGALAPLLADRPYLNSAYVILPNTCLLTCLAADRQMRATRIGGPLPRPVSRRLSLMPYAAVLATGALLLSAARSDDTDLLMIAAGSVSVTLLVAARQMVALRDNSRLLDDLDARQRELAHRATHDALTGLSNRSELVRSTPRWPRTATT
jgi:diguanylate cyclase